jgi:hypothetical protein
MELSLSMSILGVKECALGLHFAAKLRINKVLYLDTT